MFTMKVNMAFDGNDASLGPMALAHVPTVGGAPDEPHAERSHRLTSLNTL